jgi:hypothetical protein
VSTQIQNLEEFFNNVYLDIGEPSDYSVSRVSAWFLDISNLGKLNNLIGTCFEIKELQDNHCNVTGYEIYPYFKSDQLAIYKMLFDYEYFKGEARNVAKSSATKGSDWTDLREGDSSIKKINKNEISKNLRTMSRDAKEDLDKAVKMYLKYNAIPDQIAGDDTEGVTHYIIQDYQRTLN